MLEQQVFVAEQLSLNLLQVCHLIRRADPRQSCAEGVHLLTLYNQLIVSK